MAAYQPIVSEIRCPFFVDSITALVVLWLLYPELKLLCSVGFGYNGTIPDSPLSTWD